MKPIYFPFISLFPATCDAVGTLFPRVTLLRPSPISISEAMKAWEAEGRIEILIPLRGDEERLARALEDYRSWAETHRGMDLSVYKNLGDGIPFYGDLSVSRIRDDIRGKGGKDRSPDSLQVARIFLHMAEDFDGRGEELVHDFDALGLLERSLYQDLRGEQEPEPADPPAPLSSGFRPADFMVLERIRAWMRLFLETPVPEAADPIMFLTTGKAVVESILESIPDMRPLRRIENIPVRPRASESEDRWGPWMAQWLTGLSAGAGSADAPEPDPPDLSTSDGKRICFTLYRIDGKTSHEVAAALAPFRKSGIESPGKSGRNGSTLIGLIEGC